VTRVAATLFLSLLAAAQSGATLHGVVRDSNGRPVAGASISLRDGLAVRSDAQGKYSFTALPPDKYSVRAEMTGFAPASSGPFAIAAEETTQVDLILTPVKLEFFDEPNFVVAGVTDTINRGGHGSETVVHSTETVTKAAAALGNEPAKTESEESLRKAIEREPANAELHHSLAEVHEKHGNALEAAREYQRAAELNPSENNLFDWGTELLTHRAVDPSIEVFTKGHRLFPASARMLLGMGAALYARGSYDDAARRFFEATDVNPLDPAPYLFLGKVENTEMIHSPDYVARMERFAHLHPANALASLYYAVSLWNNRKDPEDIAKVEALLSTALRLNPSLGEAYFELGIVYASRKEFPKAIASYRKAIDHGAETATVHYHLAQAYQQSGDQPDARKEFDLFEQSRRTSLAEEERKRSEIQQFIFALKER
jgi:tetratricopeptide (TPR) repeat protein